jgi:hypothetical protein
MKVAHLILAHAHPEQLKRLISAIEHEDADIYLHIDDKADMKIFSDFINVPRVYFIKNRTKVRWGTYSMVLATLNSFEEILVRQIPYSHINLLSAQDYPLLPADEIHEYLTNNADKTFMHSLHIPEEWDEAIDRIVTYNFGDYQFKGHYVLQHAVKFLGIRRKMPEGITPYGRSQWFTITPLCAQYVIDYLKENPKMLRFFRMSFAPDEFVFQTVLMNSPYKSSLVNDNLRYIDFSQGGYHPKTLTTADALAVINSGKLYARKFDRKESLTLLDFIDKQIFIKNAVSKMSF